MKFTELSDKKWIPILTFIIILFIGYAIVILRNQSKIIRLENEMNVNQSFKIKIPRLLSIRKDIAEIFFLLGSKVFLLEPSLLVEFLTTEQVEESKWRFNIPDFTFNESKRSITLGAFDHDLIELLVLIILFRLEEFNSSNFFLQTLLEENVSLVKIYDQIPFHNLVQLTHLFFEMNQWKIHLVVFIHLKHFLWIGQIPLNISSIQSTKYNIQFGNYQQIFDPFQVKNIWILLTPEDIEHFLSQIPTSRYLHCLTEKMSWLQQNGIELNQKRIRNTIEAIVSIKSLMKELKMEFWMMCGTLLGWFRHCHPIPYTTDTDLSTWSKYFKNGDISNKLLDRAPRHGLHLFYRFGEPTKTLEYAFKTDVFDEKIDMFISYENETQFFIPSHIVHKSQYRHYIYPRYQLCSVELLGYKLLAPCEAEKIIKREYGNDWNRPIKKWNYVNSPLNGDDFKNFSFKVKQVQQYSHKKVFIIH